MTGGLGLVILDYNQRPLTIRLLSSIELSSNPPEDIVIVENGCLSTEADSTGLTHITNLTVLRPGKNLGCAGGRNVGLDFLKTETNADIFILLDNDTVVPRDFFESIRRVASADSDVYAPVIYHYRSEMIWSCGGTLNRFSGEIQQLTCIPSSSGPSIVVDWSPGACLIIPRDIWSGVGHFDTWLDFYFEDIDWCLRVLSMNRTVRVETSITLEHEAQQSNGGANSTSRTYLWARNGTVFRMSILRCPKDQVFSWFARELYSAARDLVSLRFRQVASRTQGLLEGIQESKRRLRQSA